MLIARAAAGHAAGEGRDGLRLAARYAVRALLQLISNRSAAIRGSVQSWVPAHCEFTAPHRPLALARADGRNVPKDMRWYVGARISIAFTATVAMHEWPSADAILRDKWSGGPGRSRSSSP